MSDIPARMRQLIGTIAQWGDDDLVIGDGEFALERTEAGSIKMKVGNGVDTYSELPYLSGGFADAATAWEDVTGTFTLNANHTSPDYPIMINVRAKFLADGGLTSILVGGMTIAVAGNGGNGEMNMTLSAVVPPGSVYRVNTVDMDDIDVWELRVP